MKLSTLVTKTWFTLSAPHDCPKWLCWYLTDWEKTSSIITTKFKKLENVVDNIVLSILDDRCELLKII